MVTNVVDFVLSIGPKVAKLEVKYSIPRSPGPALDRLVGQINDMVKYGQGPSIVWSLKEPTVAELVAIEQRVGPVVFRQIKFLHGAEDLYQWLISYFGT